MRCKWRSKSKEKTPDPGTVLGRIRVQERRRKVKKKGAFEIK